MLKTRDYEFWFVTGSQHLYGPETLKQVASDSETIAKHLDSSDKVPFRVVFKPVLTTPDAIRKLCSEANSDDNCAGIITWMHTFSPAKMWIAGLTNLRKPLMHFHTQFNRDIPWDTIDMDFMNLNQSAHGDREYGFIGARLEKARKVVTGHWKDERVLTRIGDWMKVAAAVSEGNNIKVARFGDNMREVAVTEGNKVSAQIQFGWSISGFGIGDLADRISKVSEDGINDMMKKYQECYTFSEDVLNNKASYESVREQARIEVAMKSFLEEGGFSAFTTTFEDLHGLKQLPGLAVQHLMQEGYGFGPEGDWKTAALVRIMKIMAENKGTSIMEDYTYNLESGKEMILGAHMLEVCPSLAGQKPIVEVHPLGIGGKEDPARVVFDGKAGKAVCASLIDLGNRFRLIVNDVNAVDIENPMPKLPVARVLWKPEPSLEVSTESWIQAGGAHHTSFSYNVTAEQLEDFSEICGIEFININHDTKLHDLKNELRWNAIAYKLM